jgi:Protein of unknown function (DUF1214)
VGRVCSTVVAIISETSLNQRGIPRFLVVAAATAQDATAISSDVGPPEGRSDHRKSARYGSGGWAEAYGVEAADDPKCRQRLVDEYRYDGRLRQLLSEEGDRQASRPWSELAGRPIYPLNRADESHKTLDGSNKYTIIYATCERFLIHRQSIAMYDPEGFVYPNRDQRAVSSWMPFRYNAGGSLELYFQNETRQRKEANWLLSPRAGG